MCVVARCSTNIAHVCFEAGKPKPVCKMACRWSNERTNQGLTTSLDPLHRRFHIRLLLLLLCWCLCLSPILVFASMCLVDFGIVCVSRLPFTLTSVLLACCCFSCCRDLINHDVFLQSVRLGHLGFVIFARQALMDLSLSWSHLCCMHAGGCFGTRARLHTRGTMFSVVLCLSAHL